MGSASTPVFRVEEVPALDALEPGAARRARPAIQMAVIATDGVKVSGITRSDPQRPQRINADGFFHVFFLPYVRRRTKAGRSLSARELG